MSDGKNRNEVRFLLAVCLFLTVFLSGFCSLDNNCDWGDDFAAYMTDGIAIAEGKYGEQIHTNAFLRYGSREEDAVHVHSFGMPLTHALVYRICGFDREGFHNLFIYKLPSLLLLSAMCAVYYLFLQRRADRYISVVLALVLCCSRTFFHAIQNLGNDVMFMALTVLCFYEADMLTLQEKRSVSRAAFTGFLLWALVSVRLNGFGVLAAVLLYYVCCLLKKKQAPVFCDLIPCIVFAALYLVINCLIFPKPTSTSSISDITWAGIRSGTEYYFLQLFYYFSSVIENLLIAPIRYILHIPVPGKDSISLYGTLNFFFTAAFFALMILGLLTEGFRENTAVTVFIIASFLVTSGLNLGQGLRYLYNILPFLYMYFAYGFDLLIRLRKKLPIKTDQKTKSRVCGICTAILCGLVFVSVIRSDAENIKKPVRDLMTAYSDSAVETYGFIMDNVDRDSTIAFFKPRALYLNTDVKAFLPGRNGMTVEDGDYYLYYKPGSEFLLSEDEQENYTAVFENEEFKLFEKNNN